MTLFGIRRPTDRASAHQRKEAKSGPGRRLPDKAEKPKEPAVCGWNLPNIPDDNGIMVWMKREKNGDNKRKKGNEVYEEEQYRHVTGHCAAIENKLLFDRQSLNDRYLKNCQFGLRDARANRVSASSGPRTVTRPVAVSRRPPSQGAADRNCSSANAVEGEPLDEEEGEEEVEENVKGVVRRGVSRGRSQSAVCRVDNVKDEGEDDAGWDEGYGSKVSSNDQDGREEEEGDSRVGGGGGPGGNSGISPAAAAVQDKAGPALNPAAFQAEPLSHQDAMAKLMYSRRERTVYERLPSRRMRGNSFRYAGREQSRLMEASLSHINPAYLARYHHLADLASAAAAASARVGNTSSQQYPPPPATQVVVVEGGELGGKRDGNGKGLQPRTMVLRKITIQDSGRELFSQNIHSYPGNAAATTAVGGGGGGGIVPAPVVGGAQPSEKVYHRQGLVSPGASMTPSERAASETQPHPVLRPGVGVSGSVDRVTVRVQELTPDLSTCTSKVSPGGTTTTTTTTTMTSLSAVVPSGASQARSVAMSMLSVPSTTRVSSTTTTTTIWTDERLREGGSPLLSSPASRTSPATSDRLSAMSSSFAVTDLLPALERNLRSQRTSQRGLSKSKTMGVTTATTPFNTSSISHHHHHHHQQQQQHHQHQQQQQARGRQLQRNNPLAAMPVSRLAESNGEVAGLRSGGGVGEGGSRTVVVGTGWRKDGTLNLQSLVSNGGTTGTAVRKSATAEDVRSFPDFRPHFQTTPLQRAKEIANRRMHGHVTQMPVSNSVGLDGSETLCVPSSRYASRSDQQTSHRRAKSASRLLGQVMFRYTLVKRNSAV